MKKARLTSPEAMAHDQVMEDIAMSPAQRLEVAFQISDLALEIHQRRGFKKNDSSSIQWIELRMVSVQ
jgi:hypothetical protein